MNHSVVWFFNINIFGVGAWIVTDQTPLQLHAPYSLLQEVLGNLSNDDRDVNKNGKKAIRFDWQNNDSARASRFFVRFFAVTTLLRRENAYFHVLWRTWTQDHDFLFLLLNFDTVSKNWTPEKHCQHLTNWARWNKRDKVWSSATSLFKWRFCSPSPSLLLP